MEGPASASKPGVLWRPRELEKTELWRFMQELNTEKGLKLKTFNDLHRYSVDRYTEFWEAILKRSPIVYEGSYSRVVNQNARMDSVPKWFEGLRINYAENILYTADPKSPSTRSKVNKEDDKIALIEVKEGQSSIRPLTWAELRNRVSLYATALRNHGVEEGDRIAAVVGNTIDTLCICLGTAALGCIFSTCSTDMGSNGILERLRQIKPKWVFIDDAYDYNGKRIVLLDKMTQVIAGMGGITEFQGIVSVPHDANSPLAIPANSKLQTLSSFFASASDAPAEPIVNRVPFNTGAAIVYSSGTTGPPKCIVHGAGNAIIQAWKEFYLQRKLTPSSRVLQFTTTAWIMYISAVQTLLIGSRLIMYDGSPFYPRVDSFLRLACSQGVTYFGVSPRYFATIQSAGVIPRNIPGSEYLQLITSTGMVLPQSMFHWFYSAKGFHPHTHLCNMTGGTDMAGSLIDCSPLDPVYDVGGIQAPALATDLRIYDSSIETPDEEHPPRGQEVADGQPGDLVIATPFPNMPVAFWGDKPPSHPQSKYRKAYFARFDNVWTHGDFLHREPVTGAWIMLGRADGVLNPSGVRFGSAEIYNVLETRFGAEIEDSVCVGQRRRGDEDERVVLFVKMKLGSAFGRGLVERVKAEIARALSRRHVPRFVFETREIPTTINGKKVELPLKRILSGERVVPSGTLANPGCLDFYYRFVDPEGVERELQQRRAKL